MSLSPLKFRARFPEFANLPDATIQDAIDRGAAQADATVFGTLVDEATGYLAAHFLALSPFGQQARLTAVDGKTTYMTHYMRLQVMKTGGWARVVA